MNTKGPMVVYVRQLLAPQEILAGGLCIAGEQGDFVCQANGCVWVESLVLLKKHYRLLWQMDKHYGFAHTKFTCMQRTQAFRIVVQTRFDERSVLGYPYDRVIVFASGAMFILRESKDRPGAYEYIPVHVDTRRERNVVFM